MLLTHDGVAFLPIFKAIVLDVNGTLLRTEALARPLRRIFGSKLTVECWFQQVLFYALSADRAGRFKPLSEVARSVLTMEAAARDIRLRPDREQKLLSALENLPPFREVPFWLRKLHDAGIPLAALSNSSRHALETQLRNAKLLPYFDQVVSVETVGHYKPAPECYAAVANALGLRPIDLLMVAAHPWDLQGARQTGCRTAFLRRPGKALLPHDALPDYMAADLASLSKRLLREYKLAHRIMSVAQ